MTPIEIIASVYAVAAVGIVPTWAIFQTKKH